MKKSVSAGKSQYACCGVRFEKVVVVGMAVWSVSFFGSMSSAAGASGNAPVELEEIVVSAAKRGDESLQRVPMSITALGADTLEERAVTSFFDYGPSIPNMGFGASGDGALAARSVSIRGVSGVGTSGFYLDDTPIPDSVDPHVIDIERIEVLRGPQGSLYGARSMGGTVRLISKQPDLESIHGAFKQTGSYTSYTNRGNYAADAAINVPIVPGQVALRATGFYENNAGWFKRSFPSPTDTSQTTVLSNIAQQINSGGSVSLAIRPSDALTVNERIMYQRSTSNGFPYADFTIAPNTNQKLAPDSLMQVRANDVAEGGTDEWALFSIGLNYHTSLGELVSSTSYFKRDTFETEDSTPFVQFIATRFLGVTSPISAAPISRALGLRRYVQEVRFSSALDGPFQYVAGAFYSDSKDTREFPPAYVPGLDAQSGGILGTDEQYGFNNVTHTKEPALFGELSFNATNALTLTAGLRAYRIKIDSDPAYQEGFAVGGPRINFPERSEKDSGVNPKAQVEYRLTPDAMVFTTVAKGFRPGGVGPGVPDAPAAGCQSYLVANNLTSDQTRSFGSDRLWSYELGTKTSWAEHTLSVNASIFLIKWDNIQQAVNASCGFGYTINAGAAEIKGGEMEVHARPLDGLDLSLGLGYADAKITEAGVNSPQPVGSHLAQVPDWTGTGSVTYTVPVSDGLHWVTNMTASYVGKSFSITNNASKPRERPAYSILNMRSSLSWDRFAIALIGKNITNTRANLSDNRSLAAELPSHPRIVTNQPRTIGIEFSTTW